MLRNELKAALALMGTVFVPMVSQADQSMNSNQTADQTSQPLYVPGETVKEGQLPDGYNASATYRCMDGWDVFITGDYIYWNWAQDDFKAASLVNTTEALARTTFHNGSIEDVILTPGYSSGFQVGLGFNMQGMDDWNVCAEYTWYQNSALTTESTDADQYFVLPVVVGAETYRTGSMTASANLHFNELDFLVQRPFYFGKKLTANFGAGLSALWMNQSFDVASSGTNYVLSIGNLIANTSATVSAQGKSWGLGPKFKLDANWMLGYGFRILSDISASVLYTRYTSESVSLVDTTPRRSLHNSISGPTRGVLRPITETSLGLGWGIGLYDSYHIDLSASYDFNVYWNHGLTSLKHPTDMYLHGLNIQARFDF